jgi:hypothetical protein
MESHVLHPQLGKTGQWDLLWLLRAAHGTTEKSAAQQRLSPVVEELLPCL